MKAIVIEYNGKNYKLGYTVKTVRNLSAAGFKLSDIHDVPLIAIPQLFSGAFKAQHNFLSENLITEIYENMTDRAALIGKLIEMYSDVVNAFMEDDTEKAGIATWAEVTM